jgi:hypothetical protein
MSKSKTRNWDDSLLSKDNLWAWSLWHRLNIFKSNAWCLYQFDSIYDVDASSNISEYPLELSRMKILRWTESQGCTNTYPPIGLVDAMSSRSFQQCPLYSHSRYSPKLMSSVQCIAWGHFRGSSQLAKCGSPQRLRFRAQNAWQWVVWTMGEPQNIDTHDITWFLGAITTLPCV